MTVLSTDELHQSCSRPSNRHHHTPSPDQFRNAQRTTSYSGSTCSVGVSNGADRARSPDRRINRYYDSSTGEFISVDPIVGQTGTPYTYASDNPLSKNDPLGLIPTSLQQSGNVRLTLGCGQNLGNSIDGTVYIILNSICSEHKIKWELGLEGPIVPYVTGDVTETGMTWWLNGVYKGRGSEHNRPAELHFHGTFAPIRIGDDFRFVDGLRYTAQIPLPADIEATLNVTDIFNPRFKQGRGEPITFTLY